MPNAWTSSGLIASLLVLTGCPSPPKAPARVTPLGTTRRLAPVNLGRSDESQDSRQRAEPATNPANPSVSGVPPTLAQLPLDRWVSWESWSERNGLEKPKRLENEPGPTFQFHNPNGILSLTIGSKVAYWNGLALALGFIPHLTNGHPFVHALDLVKNVVPLISLPTLVTNRRRAIVIDPGHGGENTGAKSLVGPGFEKDYTLDWALRAKPLLDARGWNVILTRTSDVDVSLAERIRLAERIKADLFVSLHFNSVDPPSARADHGGIETYCLTPAGMPSSLIREFGDDPSLTFPNNAFDVQNLQYALRLHRAVIRVSGRKDRGIRRARFMTVLREQHRPAVLLEGGYLSDPQEARLISSADFRQKLAEAVAQALE